jgi:hypothetical protein
MDIGSQGMACQAASGERLVARYYKLIELEPVAN